ncbi:MAG: DNA mismatch repair endonuclease MutL, partial [Bacteroidales bacterium]|nr:DNA mismatch repair endonuclease MutL [Bacteroidales bacterium]
MSDIIKLLPDAVANQIAAGEVVQRPASVVKELTENAIDAGANEIHIIIKDAGKTLIQVIDNGCGMTATDARMCFERHATSKIRNADDLFKIRTMGFRGEAMASIAAISEMEMRTKRHDADVGTKLMIAGSEVISQEAFQCANGTNTIVRNLFFNVPARRKFLKSDQTELKHIIEEFNRVAIPNPDIKFTLTHNDNEIIQTETGNLRQRIVHLFGKQINQLLIPVSVETSIVNIHGFIGKPEKTRKTSDQQFFFVNNRYMQHPYFRRAIMMAYENIIQPNTFPSFFIFLEVDPSQVDINIHPTKTEIKFEDERSIFQILNAGVKESLGKFNIKAPMEFTEDITRDVHLTSSTEFKPPVISLNPNYNPFETGKQKSKDTYYQNFNQNFYNENKPPANWESLYEAAKSVPNTDLELSMDLPEDSENNNFFQLKEKYILTSVKSGLMIIDQVRAHERVLFDKFLLLMQDRRSATQKQLFPEQIELNPSDKAIFTEISDQLTAVGFDISFLGKNTIAINGIPSELTNLNP